MTEETAPPSVKVRLAAYGLTVVVILAGIVGFEYLLARFWPITTAYQYSALTDYEFRPNLDIAFHTDEFSTRIRTGADGLRLPQAAKTGEKVLFLGDSFVFGHGVDGEQALPHQLETLSQGRLSVVNAGVPGYDTRREVKMLEQIGYRLSADTILVGFVLNDVLSNSGEFWFSPTATGILRYLPFPALGSLVEYLISDPAFVLFRLGITIPNRFDHLACRQEGRCAAGWSATSHWLTRLKSQSGNARVVLVRIPMPGESAAETFVGNQLGDDARRLNMDYVDLMQAPGLMERGYYKRDGHWTPEGHRLAAAYLWARLWPLPVKERP